MPSRIAEKMTDCMTSFAARGISALPLAPLRAVWRGRKPQQWTNGRPLPKCPPPMSASAKPLAILYEHPSWFQPLFAALERRGIGYEAIQLAGHRFDPAAFEPPAPLILSRVAQSGFLREPEHPIFYAASLLDHWARGGARVLNGAEVLAIDSSKARQLSLIASLGYNVPATRVVHRAKELAEAAEAMSYPFLVKANLGGSGAGIVRYASRDELLASIDQCTVPESVDQVLLVQDYVPP